MRRLALLSLFAFLACTASARAGDEAALSGTFVNGTKFDIAEDRGRVVIVNFWATWCTPCRAEMPMLDRFYADHRGEGVMLIGVSEDSEENVAKVREAMATMHYPSAILGALDDNSFGHPHILPVTYIVGPDGQVRAVLRPSGSPLTDTELWSAVAPLLVAGPRR